MTCVRACSVVSICKFVCCMLIRIACACAVASSEVCLSYVSLWYLTDRRLPLVIDVWLACCWLRKTVSYVCLMLNVKYRPLFCIVINVVCVVNSLMKHRSVCLFCIFCMLIVTWMTCWCCLHLCLRLRCRAVDAYLYIVHWRVCWCSCLILLRLWCDIYIAICCDWYLCNYDVRTNRSCLCNVSRVLACVACVDVCMSAQT